MILRIIPIVRIIAPAIIIIEPFNVQVGLGNTMTEQDIAEGRINIAIRIAALHPAEFIILTLTISMRTA